MTTTPHNGQDGLSTPPLSGPANSSPTAELTALAARSRQLIDRVDDLDRRCQDLEQAVTTEVLPQLADLRDHTADQLAEHADQLRHLADTVTADRQPPNDWATMDVARAATEWANLADWIERTLVPWYEITRDQLPDCWALHRPAVIQLAWLHTTHRAAHRPDAAPHLTAEWHTRWLPAVLHAIRQAIPRRGPRTCGPGHHLLEESQRARHHPSSLPPTGTATAPTKPPGEQLAERMHWKPCYEQAVVADRGYRQRP